MIKLKENNNFKQQDLPQFGLTKAQEEIVKHVPIYEALNTENYRYSLKEAYKSKSMSPSMVFDRSDASDSDSSEEQIQIEETNGKRITKTKSQILVETTDEVKLRGRRPVTSKYDKATSLNF